MAAAKKADPLRNKEWTLQKVGACKPQNLTVQELKL